MRAGVRTFRAIVVAGVRLQADLVKVRSSRTPRLPWRQRALRLSLCSAGSGSAHCRKDCSTIPASVSTTVLDRNGAVLYEARSKDGTRNARLTPDALPENVVNATIAAEDQRFWRHPGVDPFAITRAALRDARALRVEQGGSTVTQQVAKLLLARLPAGDSSCPASRAASPQSFAKPSSPSDWNIVCRSAKSSRCI